MLALVLVTAAGCSANATPKAAGSHVPAAADTSESPVAEPSAAPSTAPSGPLFTPTQPVTMNVKGFWSWAYYDHKTDQMYGSTPYTTSDTASMAKAWVAADWLRRQAESNKQPGSTALNELSRMIRDSETENTFKYHVQNGNLTSIKRMISLCGLTETKGTQNSWSLTQMSARDVARLAKCIGDGRAAGPKWTGWLLNEMRSVRGPGRFGPIEVLPADVQKTTAIKNGWLARDDGQWHIACMALGDGWSMAVMAHYPSSLGKDYGVKTCREVTKQLLTQH
nr:serine hydrolase [Dactylosporangium thailandense]